MTTDNWKERLWYRIAEWSSIDDFEYSDAKSERLHLEAARDIDAVVEQEIADAYERGRDSFDVSPKLLMTPGQITGIKNTAADEAYEKAAKVAEARGSDLGYDNQTGDSIASSIRDLKDA